MVVNDVPRMTDTRATFGLYSVLWIIPGHKFEPIQAAYTHTHELHVHTLQITGHT